MPASRSRCGAVPLGAKYCIYVCVPLLAYINSNSIDQHCTSLGAVDVH